MARDEITICVCEDDELYQSTLRLWLAEGFNLVFSQTGDHLLQRVRESAPDLVLLDLRLKGGATGFDVLGQVKAAWPDLPVIIHSGLTDHQSVVRAMRLGATDYIPKECTSQQVIGQLRQIGMQRRRARAAAPATHAMVGSSPAMLALRNTLRRIRKFPGNVIITGESGAGKELVARSLRRDGAPFITVDASTIQQSTAESMLFGHERGAFTGAERARCGLLEEADGGAVYFDEIANMSMDVQAKLLRALQEKEIVRLGASKVRRLSFRVICATNRDLEGMCREGLFRDDLYARLNVFTLRVPPLRERPEDLPVLVAHFLTMQAPDAEPPVSAAVLQRLNAYEWPGNVRELCNVVQYMLAMSDDGPIDISHLPAKIQACSDTTLERSEAMPPPRVALPAPLVPPHAPCEEGGGFHDRLRAFERDMLVREYALAAGNVSRMARALEMDRSQLYHKLIEFEIHAPQAKKARAY